MAGKKRGRRKSDPSAPAISRCSVVGLRRPMDDDGPSAITDANARGGRDEEGESDAPIRPPGRKRPRESKRNSEENCPVDVAGRPYFGEEKKREQRVCTRDATIVRHISAFLLSTKTSKSSLPNAASAANADDDNDDNVDDINVASSQLESPALLAFSIQHLVNFLTVDSSDKGVAPEEDGTVVNREDVAALLLPWSVGNLMRLAAPAANIARADDAADAEKAEDVGLAWKALFCCLDAIISSPQDGGGAVARVPAEGGAMLEGVAATLSTTSTAVSSSREGEALLSACLSQGALNRLVTYAVCASFASSCSSSVQNYASKAFLLLVKRFHPPLDIACNELLCEVDTLILTALSTDTNSEIDVSPRRCILLPSHQVKVVSGTLALIRSLMPNANPKRLFAIICSAEVLPLLGRLMTVQSLEEVPHKHVHATDDEQGNAAAATTTIASTTPKYLVKDILWQGLFHPAHHMNGFCNMWELSRGAMPSLMNLSISEEGDAAQRDAGEFTADNIPVEETTASKGGRGRKSCFQSSLFTSLQTLMSIPSKVADVGDEAAMKIAICNAAATANVLPIITHGFFRRILDDRQQRMETVCSGGSTTEADAGLQFRFWCRAIHPTLKLLSIHRPVDLSFDQIGHGEMNLALLEAMSETLGLVLKFDAYSPLYEDRDGWHLKFLENVTEGLLKYVDRMGVGFEARSNVLLMSLRHLLLLNHRLLHERLAGMVSFACSCLPAPCACAGEDDLSLRENAQKADTLLTETVRTYQELRQVGHFLSSIRSAFAYAAGRVDVSSFRGKCGHPEWMKNLLQSGNIMDSLSMAYQSCPSGQLREIWDFFDGWIVETVDQNFASDGSVSLETLEDPDAPWTSVKLLFVVQMFIIFIKDIRADKQNSPGLREMCERSMNTSVAKILGKAHGCQAADISRDSMGCHDTLMQQGFDLCGWLVDLHSRSYFWSDGIVVAGPEFSFLLMQNDDADEFNVLSYLHNMAKRSVSSEEFKVWKSSWLQSYWQSPHDGDHLKEFLDIGIPALLRGSLQRMALRRIHQLHSMIHYRNAQEIEFHQQDDSSSRQALTAEARMLVDFSLYIAVSQLTTQYGPRSDANDSKSSESLWSPLAQSLCIWVHYCHPFHAELFLIWFFSTLCQKHAGALPAQTFRVEKIVGTTLARDASFYDVSEVMSLFMRVGIQFALKRFLDCISTTGKPFEKILFQKLDGVTVSCMELAETGNIKLSANKPVDTVATTLSFLASIPLELSMCNENLNLLDAVIGLNILSSQVNKQAPDGHECNDLQLLSNIVCSTTIIVANILPKTLLSFSDFDAPCLENLTIQLSKNCSQFRSDYCVLSASTDAISEYFYMCINYHDKKATLLENFFTQLEAMAHSAAADDFVANTTLIRSVIRRINILDRRHSLSKKGPTNTSSYESCMNFIEDVHRCLQDMIIYHVASAGSNLECSKAATSALLLESEILSFFGRHLATTPVTNLMTNQQKQASRESVQKVLELIDGFQGSKCSLELNNASTYFLASMAATPGFFVESVSPLSVFEIILKALAASHRDGQDSPLLDATLCSLIRNADLEQTKFITTSLLGEQNDGKRHNPAFIIKIFHLLMTCASSQEQHKFISGKCNTFLFLSMGLLRDRSCTEAQVLSNVKLFSKTMTVLISKKGLLLLSGREIAMILCEMNLLHGAVEDPYNDAESETFKSCCSVVASLIAHYPKQLYGCPSPLFSLLLALLSHVLQAGVKQGLSLKALEYAKVCELLIPHKGIFKKHVVSLILRYIQALSKGMNPTTKSKLMPSIYALLDMCSDFETRQINAMIDVPNKTLFAPVFQSYQKNYEYRGQA